MFTGINDACAILVSSISYLWVVKTWFRVLVLVKARLGEMVVFSDGKLVLLDLSHHIVFTSFARVGFSTKGPS